jgi:hypothetical protein
MELKKNDQEGAQADMAAAAAIRPTIAEELGSYGIELQPIQRLNASNSTMAIPIIRIARLTES